MIVKVEGERRLPAAPEAAMGVLADYPRYAEWVPEVAHARVLAAEGDVAVVELAAPGRERPPLLLEIVRTGNASLLFQQVDRYRRSGLAGSVDLVSEARGTEVVARARLTFGTGVFDVGCRRRLRDRLERLLAALAGRLEAGAAAPVRAPAATQGRRRLLLEVVRTARGIELRLPGEEPLLAGPPRERGA